MSVQQLIDNKAKVAVIGLGYVGMPLAVGFSAKGIAVIGYDLNETRIAAYQAGIDMTNEVGNEVIAATTFEFTADESKLQEAMFHIIAVPTPVNQDKTPNLYPVESASRTVGRQLKKGSYVVYESTVYPGVTEEVCIPLLEEASGLICGKDFFVGYSPERINPGDQEHRLENIVKIVSGTDAATLETIANLYEIVVEAGVHRASSIKVAEAAKVVENSQRDINIAFMNELSKVFDRMGVNTFEVVEAMNTKWNALGFYPGLVGGHCIGVDPYYFIYEAEKLGYHSQIVLAGRQINDSMSEFVSENIIKKIIEANLLVKGAKVVILGVTFKPNTPDIRNSKIYEIVQGLLSYGVDVQLCDALANGADVQEMYGLPLQTIADIKDADCVVMGSVHDEYQKLTPEIIDTMYKQTNEQKIMIEMQSRFYNEYHANADYLYWSL
ncbi:nucleotide sugar dehydrogenase [Brochothrix thermosphacta]|uniref:nucleotide sugar dehydrogenase n=1 Tax=Brochothrix thermosphacta TaxID=2756 RepID=UPI00083FC370|nr:nucleotide sugar dehydrogenase [Brochothrix thermosphacta]ODJ64109.1 UDP-N-acetyl-D-galactosamine dehydrogenase [Brochothrix thermosphacta]ODJ67380.1 UDP-N-acetyl-D-galactosamine dehydrogenase [Brochothrix thermosphacta]SPN70801.1 putative UDP-glucose 6-dehydrogenase (Protein CapL) [Brochothrix thermosphacta]